MLSKVESSGTSLKQNIASLVAIVLGIINILKGDPILALVGMAGVAAYYLFENIKITKKSLSSIPIVSGLIGIFSFIWLGFWTSPVQAQFFTGAEDFFENDLQIDAGTVDFVFFTIRAVFILYLVIAFLNVFNTVRQDDDWLQAARTPALVMLFVTAADFLTNFILTGTN